MIEAGRGNDGNRWSRFPHFHRHDYDGMNEYPRKPAR